MTKKVILTNAQLERLNNCEAVKHLMESRDLPVSFSFELGKLIKTIQSPLDAYLTERRKIIEKYADRDKEGNMIQKDGILSFEHKKPFFRKEFNDLLSLSSKIDAQKLSINLGEIPKGILSPQDLIDVEPIINIISAKKK